VTGGAAFYCCGIYLKVETIMGYFNNLDNKFLNKYKKFKNRKNYKYGILLID
jgi:hypothetical protein